jgi:predicted Rossmann-fold nucleotide-binding protein
VIDKMEFTDVDELVIAQGDNLQERKRLLWETCDCVVVLPGGTGACVFGVWCA